MPWAWVHLALWSAISDPGSSQPEPEPELAQRIDVRWEAPAPCPDETAVRGDVAAMLDEARADAASFAVTITPEADGFRLDLKTRWRDGREDARTFEAGSCEALTDAAVLLMAISLDPVSAAGNVRDHGWDRATARGAREPAPEPEPEPEPVSEPEPPGPPPARAPAPVPDDGDLTFGIRPELTVDWGTLPRLAPGPGLNLSITWKLLRAELSGLYLPQQRATRSDVQKQGAWVDLGAVAPRLCITPTAHTVSFPVCAGVELGASRARGIGTVLAHPEVRFWAAATGGPTLIWAFIPRLAMAIGLDIVVPITRTAVVTSNLDRLHAPESVVLRPHLGLEVRL